MCAHTIIVMATQKGKVPWNLSVDAELKRLVKIQCAADGTDVSEVTEKLYRDYLKENKVALKIAEPSGDYRGKGRRKK